MCPPGGKRRQLAPPALPAVSVQVLISDNQSLVQFVQLLRQALTHVPVQGLFHFVRFFVASNNAKKAHGNFSVFLLRVQVGAAIFRKSGGIVQRIFQPVQLAPFLLYDREYCKVIRKTVV